MVVMCDIAPSSKQNTSPDGDDDDDDDDDEMNAYHDVTTQMQHNNRNKF